MLNSVTFSPTAATMPVVSCPKIRGAECDPVAIFFRSVPQMPQVWTRTRISAGPIRGTGMVSTLTSLTPRYTAAAMVGGMACCLKVVPSCAATDMSVLASCRFRRVVIPSTRFWREESALPGSYEKQVLRYTRANNDSDNWLLATDNSLQLDVPPPSSGAAKLLCYLPLVCRPQAKIVAVAPHSP